MALVACVLALSAGGAWWAVRSRHGGNDVVRSTAPVQRTLTRLTSGSGLQTDVTWSPDGRFIAYAADRTGNFDIWVQSVGGGDPVQVTRSAAQDTQPDWSPDGSTLVFRSERDGGGLFLVPALGGVERQLTSFGSYPFWSPDNSEILFVDEAGLGSIESPLRLFAVPAEEGPPRAILADFLVGGSWSWIARHPDGRISVLGHHRQLGRGFFTMARDGTRLVQSKESPDFPLRVYAGGGFVRRRFRWHPSGSALYVQTESNGVYNLWRVRVDPNTLRWVSAERLTTGAGPDVTPALSRDGTRLAFSTEQESARLWVFPLDPVARRLGAGKPVTEDDAKAVTFRPLARRSIARVHAQAPRHRSYRGVDHEHRRRDEPVGRAQRGGPMLVARRKGDCVHLLSRGQAAAHREGGRSAVGGPGALRQPVEHERVHGFRLERRTRPRWYLFRIPSCWRDVVGTLADDETRCRQTGPRADLEAKNGSVAGAFLAQRSMAQLCRHQDRSAQYS
jgi:hypothetical protein